MTDEFPNESGSQAKLGMGRPILLASVLAIALVGGIGGWAATAHINAAVIANGVVQVDRELQLVQHADGGAIAEIYARPGQSVTAGEILARLDTYQAETELSALQAEYLDLSVRAARLKAERDGAETLVLPETLNPEEPTVARAFAGEIRRFNDNLHDRNVRLQLLSLRLDRLGRDYDALSARESSLARQSELAEENLLRNAQLVGRGIVSSASMSDLEAQQARLRGEYSMILAEMDSKLIQQQELQIEITELKGLAASEAHRLLREIEPRLMDLELLIARQHELLERSVIRAPVDGVLNEVLVNTIGQVLGAGQTMTSIVPRDATLVVEFRVNTTDIDQISSGQEARLRFLAFDQRTTPEILGQISHLAAASVTDAATGMSYFIANALPIDDNALPEGAQLMPGMPVEVYVQTRARTPIDYLLQPIQDGIARAMTEG